MIDVQAHLDELKESGLYRRLRMVSGPQGPRVLLDGKPVLLLCSDNYLGLADHPHVREAAAEAAMRWGAGAGSSRLVSGTMTLHRRFEEYIAEFHGYETSLLFGSGYLANIGVIPALASEGEVIFSDERNHPSIADGCRLAAAETFIYHHRDVEHLAWGLEKANGRGALIATNGVFGMDGDVAPLPQIVELAHRYDARVLVDESDATGAVGPGGRGTAAAAGLEGEVDVMIGSMGKSLGSYGAYVCCDELTSRYLANASKSLMFSTALPPAAVAGAKAALELLLDQPRRVSKLQRNAAVMRSALAQEGFPVCGPRTQIIPVVVGEVQMAVRLAEAALEHGIFAQSSRPPAVADDAAGLRITVMASHTERELRVAAGLLARAALRVGFKPAETSAWDSDDLDEVGTGNLASAA